MTGSKLHLLIPPPPPCPHEQHSLPKLPGRPSVSSLAKKLRRKFLTRLPHRSTIGMTHRSPHALGCVRAHMWLP